MSVNRLEDGDARDTQPTLGFQRVLQRAVYHVQSSGRKEVTGANVLVAIFGEKDSHAVYFLNQQDVHRLDAVSYTHLDVYKRQAMGRWRKRARVRSRGHAGNPAHLWRAAGSGAV